MYSSEDMVLIATAVRNCLNQERFLDLDTDIHISVTLAIYGLQLSDREHIKQCKENSHKQTDGKK
jgi:hypothetical protein